MIRFDKGAAFMFFICGVAIIGSNLMYGHADREEYAAASYVQGAIAEIRLEMTAIKSELRQHRKNIVRETVRINTTAQAMRADMKTTKQWTDQQLAWIMKQNKLWQDYAKRLEAQRDWLITR